MKPMKMKEIAEIIAMEHDTTLLKMKGSSRRRVDVIPRHRAMKAMFEIGHSFAEISRFFDRDHTTVINACRKEDELYDVQMIVGRVANED